MVRESRASDILRDEPRRRRRARRVRVVALIAAVVMVGAGCRYVYVPFNSQMDQPVVLTGAKIPRLVGVNPTRVVGFRFDAAKQEWVQFPVQVDQRVVVPFGNAPARNDIAGIDGSVYGWSASTATALQYADPATFVGADTDPMVDADDEIVFMGRDAGAPAPAGIADPPGVVAGSGTRVQLTNGAGTSGDAYLFHGQPGVDPSAGLDYVEYNFVLDSGDYKTTYKRADGPNPERSTVKAFAYRLGMIDRWKTVDMHVLGGTGVDILDGLKARFSFQTCGRSNETFAEAEGAFVANIDGPVRGIRSYVGANSGPLTQETLFFYSDRVESVVDLRVHSIGSVVAFADFSAAASGMKYGSSTTAPITIDGIQDSVSTTAPAWQYAAGPQGMVTWATELSTSVAGLTTSFEWHDERTPTVQECWGDGSFYGAGGMMIGGGIPNTDPRTAPFDTFRNRSVYGFWASWVDADSWTREWAPSALTPLSVTASPR